MKAKPNSQVARSGKAGSKGRCLLHRADEPEIDVEQVRQRASRLSGVLNEILKRPDSPEPSEFQK